MSPFVRGRLAALSLCAATAQAHLSLRALPLLLAAAVAPPLGAQAEPLAPSAFVVKPYLQIGRNLSPTTLHLLWHTPDESADWAVETRPTSSAAWTRAGAPQRTRVAVAGVTPRWVLNAALTGLPAGGEFEYRLLRNDHPVFSAKALAPKAAEQTYRFVAFGDVGAGTAEQKAMALRAWLSKPDLVVVPGDIVYEYGLVSEYDKNFWPTYNADEPSGSGVPLMRRVPMFTVPGNHDIDNRDLDRFPDGLAYYFFWDQPLNGPTGTEGGPIVPKLTANETNRRQFLAAAGDAYPRMANYSFDYGNTHWTVLDSNPYVDWTNKELQAWVAHDLASATQATWRIVTFHHPGFNSSNEHLEQQHMRLLAPIFEAGKVDLVLSGHLHNYQRTFPMTFKVQKNGAGTLLMGGKDGTRVRGRVVNGRWTLDKNFDGETQTKPQGVIYVVTGAGGKELYDVDQNDAPDSWQPFTKTFVSNVHSLTIVDVKAQSLHLQQVTAEGRELDAFTITK
ncbi:metallophosphoesterase [Methylosinus sp. LW4]|uniref:metallophosphoesterase n=1 Tax=Methylosinus sp. LW4 TaxID=136993 RepID=UPI0012FCCA47|nr:metallophosphoesterase [Methylosinus sp. LW4]